jgi:hypothetical protein
MFNGITTITNFFTPGASEETLLRERKQYAKWVNLFTVPHPPHMAPMITENPHPREIYPMLAIMAAMGEIEEIWEPFSEEELKAGAIQFQADLENPGVFDKRIKTQELEKLMCESRLLTRSELILTMKCPFLQAHRLQAIRVNFDKTRTQEDPHRYVANDKCICAKINFGYFFYLLK